MCCGTQKSLRKFLEDRGLDASGSKDEMKARMNFVLDKEYARGRCQYGAVVHDTHPS